MGGEFGGEMVGEEACLLLLCEGRGHRAAEFFCRAGRKFFAKAEDEDPLERAGGEEVGCG